MFSVIKKRRIFYFYKRCILPLRANDIKKYERREDYKFDDSFSAATSTARLAFVGREFFTCSSLSLRQSSFCFRVLSCSVRISEASGEWCSCSTKRLTRRLVTLFEASYSEDEVTTGSLNPRPPMRTGRPRRSRSTLWSVTAGMRTSLIALSSGSSNSAISGHVLWKYVQRCRRPKVRAA